MALWGNNDNLTSTGTVTLNYGTGVVTGAGTSFGTVGAGGSSVGGNGGGDDGGTPPSTPPGNEATSGVANRGGGGGGDGAGTGPPGGTYQGGAGGSGVVIVKEPGSGVSASSCWDLRQVYRQIKADEWV